MKSRPPRTLLEVAITNQTASGVGPIRAAKRGMEALTTAIALAIAAHQDAGAEGWPTQIEYAAYWKITDRTAQREWSRFRQAFPDEETPDRLAKELAAAYGQRLADKSSAAFVYSLPAQGALAAA